ncbi:O-antigen ligase [Methylococcus sp. EFPC2]|uniref:O-antigen ligase family protein n=1 Tax=Methylococcus sp. EFPC2 TaxID=2812648 RepID=UPI001967F985|nr:O-antigen ligase family protein [Methylococcus sp. EFPC2]QSA96242.1 O-antigen ligase family protein [Methylococcus sp. EFPC2]
MNDTLSPAVTAAHHAAEPAWVTRCEWAALGGFSLGLALSKALANVSLALLAAPFLWHLIHHRARLWADPMVRIGAAWVVYVTVLGVIEFYLLDLKKLPSFIEVYGYAFIPLFAAALQGRAERVRISLLLALAGLSIKILLDGHWFEPGPIFDYANWQKALGVNRNNTAPLIDAGLLGLILWLNEQRSALFRRPGVATVALLPVLGLLLYVWVTLSSRASWISTVAAVLLALACLYVRRAEGPAGQLRTLVGTLAVVAVLVGYGFGPAMFARLTDESDTWQALLSGDWQHVPLSSLGTRFRLAHIGLDYFFQRPLTGWGPNVKELIAINTLYPESSDNVQLHNGMVELLVRTGLIGVAFYAAAALVVYRAARELPTILPHGTALFAGLMGTFAIIVLNNFSISLIYFQHGWQLILFAGGLAYGHRYRFDAPQKV